MQLTTDGHKPYLTAVDKAFGGEIDYAQLVKIYGADVEGQKRYSPAQCIGTRTQAVVGDPDPNHISTSYVQRSNLSIRPGAARPARAPGAIIAFQMEELEVQLQVSVLIVSYNSAGALRRCLRALGLSAEPEKVEILVVDNGSFDESPSLDGEFPGVTFLRLPRNFGYTKAVNIAMRTAKADFFLLLDPRAEVSPDTVATLAAQLSRNEDAVAVCPLLVTPEGEPAPKLYRLPNAATVWPAARAGAFAPAAVADLEREAIPVEFHSLAAFLCRAYFLKGLRYIDQRYAHSWADAELCAQIRRSSRKVLLVPAARVVWHAEDAPASLPPAARALLSADWMAGAATYAGKHFGFAAGLKIRILAALWSFGQTLAALLRFRDVRYHAARFTAVLSGRKIDGTQTVL